MALTYDESFALMTSGEFGGRVQVALLKYADSIKGEDPTTPAHNTRYKWADRAQLNPAQTAREIQPPTVMDAAVQEAGVDEDGKALIADDALQGSVEATVNKLM
jgi:hypothetical protein